MDWAQFMVYQEISVYRETVYQGRGSILEAYSSGTALAAREHGGKQRVPEGWQWSYRYTQCCRAVRSVALVEEKRLRAPYI